MGSLQNSNDQNSDTHNSKLINWDQLRNRIIHYSITQNSNTRRGIFFISRSSKIHIHIQDLEKKCEHKMAP